MKRLKQKVIIDEINFDSLMDILTCLVGIILLIIVLTVIEARGINIKMFLPISKSPSKEKKRVMCICENDRIKFMDTKESVVNLLNFEMELNYENVPKIVEMANKKNISDKYFDYKLDFITFQKNDDTVRDIILIIEKNKNVIGESISDLDNQASSFRKSLDKFDPNKIWVAFSVDYKSIKAFKKAREICKNNNFTTGWDPGSIEFPIKIPIYFNNNNDSGYGNSIFIPKPSFSREQ